MRHAADHPAPPSPTDPMMTDEKDLSADERAALEISLPTAMELCRLGLATMIDIRQSFEIEMKGAIPDTVHIPMFEVKLMLGHTLTEDEQDILDAGEPKELDAQSFFRMINQLHHARDHLLLCICNSGRRSLTAACAAAFARLPQSLVGRRRFSGLEETGGPCPRRQRLPPPDPSRNDRNCLLSSYLISSVLASI
jgi:rhodanese-related sulfurtransferase